MPSITASALVLVHLLAQHMVAASGCRSDPGSKRNRCFREAVRWDRKRGRESFPLYESEKTPDPFSTWRHSAQYEARHRSGLLLITGKAWRIFRENVKPI